MSMSKKSSLLSSVVKSPQNKKWWFEMRIVLFLWSGSTYSIRRTFSGCDSHTPQESAHSLLLLFSGLRIFYLLKCVIASKCDDG